MIIYDYDDYNKKQYIHKNRDFVSTEMFIKNSKKYIYDSFIFGSSTVLFLPPSIWKQYIETQNTIFSFDASSENIVGVWSKIKYLDENKHKIKFALIAIDPSIFDKFNNSVPIFMKHYEVYPSSKFYFHYEYFLNFLDLRFLFALAQYKLGGRFHSYMDDMMETQQSYTDPVTNEYFNTGILNELRRDSLGYYEKRLDRFPSRASKYVEASARINQQQIIMLNEIRDIFKANNTDYRIIICPIYDQIAFNKNDVAILQNIFGNDNVFDFSGINEFTDEKSNYYDGTHFKKYVGKEVLDIVYEDAIIR